MIRPSRFMIPSALLAVALASPSSIQGQSPAAELGAAAGQVIQGITARGVMGAFLLAFDRNGEVVGRGLSGRDGFFTIALPPGGPYRLEVESMGYRVATADSLRISVADTLRVPPIHLLPDSAALPREP